MSDKEAFYDEQIAPRLREIQRLCLDNGLSMAAMVEWDPENFGRTLTFQAHPSYTIRLVDLVMRSHGNVDALIGALISHAQEHGDHSSIYLHMLGAKREADNA